MTVQISMTAIENPYVQSMADNNSLWGTFSLQLGETMLYDNIDFDMFSIVEWFTKAKDKLNIEKFPYEIGPVVLPPVIDKNYPTPIIDINREVSIAEKFDIIWSLLIDKYGNTLDNSSYNDILSEYAETHLLKIRGTGLQSYYIGLNHENVGEISVYDKEYSAYKRYFFDMNKFVSLMHSQTERFLTEWKEKYATEPGLIRLKEIGW
jgi:hypothetical protein